jgi:5'-3' exoribonuclease 1
LALRASRRQSTYGKQVLEACKLMVSRNAETTNYYLLHLTLLREYLDLEFRDIEPMMPFEYSLERVIDDFILIAVFIGNDFMPHLPDLHIHENGLERLFEVYKRILPSLGLSSILFYSCFGLTVVQTAI